MKKRIISDEILGPLIKIFDGKRNEKWIKTE